MTDKIERVRVPSDGMTLNRFLWSVKRAPTAGRVEAVLDLNPGLSGQMFLSAGQEILIPRVADEPPKETQIISLWE